MNSNPFRKVVFAASLALALSACQRNDETQPISNGQPVPGSVPVQVQVGPTRDPSLPDASAVAAQMAADKAREDALAQQSASAPAAQESTALPSEKPMASQSNVPLTPAPEGTKLN